MLKAPVTVDEIIRAVAVGNIRLRTIAAHLNRAEREVDPALQKARKSKLVRYSPKDGWVLRAPAAPTGSVTRG